MALVSTTIGDIPESDLDEKVEERDDGDSWSVKRELTYKGTAHPESVGQIVRRDCWVTFKTGHAAQGTSNL